MIRVVNKRSLNNTPSICVGTHNGVFHCDEVVAVAILSILMKKIGDIDVIRSRDQEVLANNTDLLVDVGGGEFDHHQKGGNGARENGVKYASAGLVWRALGKAIVKKLANNNLSDEEIAAIANNIDTTVIEKVDMEDNGQLVANHPFKFITAFLPKWNQEDNYDEKFEECANVVSTTLQNIIETHIGAYQAKNEIAKRIINPETHINNVLVLPCQGIPWVEPLINYNNNSIEAIDFVVFPYPAGGYALHCVPPSMDAPFSQRIPLPEDWAGETTRLPAISGVATATFCHNGRFFARANEYDDIIKLCRNASSSYRNRINICR